MKIAIGGLSKNEMKAAIEKAAPEVEAIITTDMGAVPMLKADTVDYYFGACESGGGAAISILIAMLGYDKCCTVCKNAGKPNREEIDQYIKEGKRCFGMTVGGIEETVPVLIAALLEARGQ